MQRKVFDFIASAGGAVMVVVLVVAGSLLMWGYSFTTNSVHNQLAQQDITFPTAAEFAHAKAGTEITPGMLPYLLKYAGAAADHRGPGRGLRRPLHRRALGCGDASRAASTPRSAPPLEPTRPTPRWRPKCTTSFQSTTLRGLLLEAYAFSEFGLIALWAGIAAFVLAGVMALLVAFGFWHARRTPAEARARGARGGGAGARHHLTPDDATYATSLPTRPGCPAGRVESRARGRA